MLCDPADSEDVAKLALPPLTLLPDAIVFDPSLKVTDPELTEGDIFAVNVMFWPGFGLYEELVMLVPVEFLFTGKLTALLVLPA